MTAATWEERMSVRARERRRLEEAAAVAEEEAAEERATASVRDTLQPGADAAHCAHGLEYGRNWLGDGVDGPVAWAGGVAFCECCRSNYGYVDMAMFGGRNGGVITDKHLCEPCGGRIHRYGQLL